MILNNKKVVGFLLCAVGMLLVSGCTDWKKEYNLLNAEYQNLKGRLEYERGEKGDLAAQLSQGRKQISELQRQIDELNASGGKNTGFEGDVNWDPKEGTITVTLPNAILFNSGKAELKKSTSSELDQIASVLNSKYANQQVAVVGHTDSDPIKKSKWTDNWELSSHRALTVVRYLISKGVPDEQIRAVGRGSSQPVESNASASGKAKNRRVEIVVYMR